MKLIMIAMLLLICSAVGTVYADVGSFYDSFYEGIHGRTNADITWRIKATANGINLEDTTVGSIDIYVTYETPY